VNLLLARFCYVIVQPSRVKMFAANATEIPVLGRARIRFTVESILVTADVLVSNAIDEFLLYVLSFSRIIPVYGIL
jgi:hypothetical protein